MGQMRIKQLELLGFKSFKNKTTLTFPAGITVVVGPNGCGKSNIVDALRWVLGEQSPKHLRGQEMSDVVFAGNDENAPLGMADVTLLLENTDAPGHLTNSNGDNAGAQDWTEVMVSRRYFRSGESEYLFNKVPCRLRDIVEFFLGTGAGTKAYSIIEQGRVDALISAKPQDIRILVEEAAGVSLYRSRRLTAERKLERTHENLSRVADILHEMDRQLASLRLHPATHPSRRQARVPLTAGADALPRRPVSARVNVVLVRSPAAALRFCWRPRLSPSSTRPITTSRLASKSLPARCRPRFVRSPRTLAWKAPSWSAS